MKEPMATPRFTWPEIERIAKEIVAERLGVDFGDVRLDADFVNDLGADSLDSVELAFALGERFGVQIPDEAIEGSTSLAEGFRRLASALPPESRAWLESNVLSFRLRQDGRMEVSLQLEDGSWAFADGQVLLPSMLCLFTVSRWGSVLRELEALVNDPRTREEDLQHFLESYPELIAGDEYDRVVPQATIAREDGSFWHTDFVLAPFDQANFCKVLELKLPTVALTGLPRRSHVTFSAKIWSAICQLRDYATAFEAPAVRERFQKRYGLDVYRPDLHLLAGRSWDLQWLDSIRTLRKTSEVKIEDWDSLLKRLKRRYS